MTYQQIIKDLENENYYPLYFLSGDEPYYIDAISNYIAEHVLDEMEREFNQSVFYGLDTDIETILSEAKRFPMGADRQVVIVKEAQNIRNLIKNKDEKDPLLEYLKNPQPTTLLVFCYKFKKLDSRTALAKKIKEVGVLFRSEKIKDWKVADWITSYVQQKGFTINPRNASLLADYLGNDLSKIENEIGKVIISLPPKAEIDSDIIQRNIGISKDYNVFELQKAISERKIGKVNKIIKYYADNPKEHPIFKLMYNMYNYFSKLLLFHTIKNKNDRDTVAATIGVHPFFVKEYQAAGRNYPYQKVKRIIGYLREADVKAKGVENVSTSHGDLMKELFYKILH